jgi:hypothetical protein
MRLAILAGVAATFASAAWAQDPDCRPTNGMAVASKEFVTNLKAAQLALAREDWSTAIGSAALARPHAMDGHQRAALTQIDVTAYFKLGTPGAREQMLEKGIAEPCMPAGVHKNYRQMLDKLRAEAAAAEEQ